MQTEVKQDYSGIHGESAKLFQPMAPPPPNRWKCFVSNCNILTFHFEMFGIDFLPNLNLFDLRVIFFHVQVG